MSFQRAPASLLQRLFLLLLVLMIGLLPFIPSVSAREYTAEEPFVVSGSFAGTFELNSSRTGLFNLEGVAPGDTWTGTIVYKNTCTDKMTVSLLEVRNDLEDSTLFDALTLSIKQGDEVIYDGTYGFSNPIFSDVVLESGQELVLDVTVELPIHISNVIQNKKMVSTWIFEAKYYGNAAPPTGADILLDNVADGTVICILLFALIGIAIVCISLRNAKKATKEEVRSENHEEEQHS